MNEVVWRKIFDNEMKKSEIQDKWSLYVVRDLPQECTNERHYEINIFGSFQCSVCRFSWSSSNVSVLCLMNLNKSRRFGTVKMRIFRQECKRCPYPVMEDATISHENMKILIHNLVKRIQRKYYEMYDPTEDRNSRTYGRLEGPHEKKHCEACRLGVCAKQEHTSEAWEWQLQTVARTKDVERSSLSSSLQVPHEKRHSQAYRNAFYVAEEEEEAWGMQKQRNTPQKDDEDSSLATLFGSLALGGALAVGLGVGAYALWKLSEDNDEEEKKKYKK